MFQYDDRNNVFLATNVSDLLETELCSGRVFSVYVRPMFTPKGRCLVVRVALTADEGAGRRFEFIMANNQVDTIPTQVELALMELDCVPTWIWDYSFSNLAYQCQFARSRSHKAVSDSGSYRFEKVL